MERGGIKRAHYPFILSLFSLDWIFWYPIKNNFPSLCYFLCHLIYYYLIFLIWHMCLSAIWIENGFCFLLQSFDRKDCCCTPSYEMSSSSRASSNSRFGFYQHFPCCSGGCHSHLSRKLILGLYTCIYFIQTLNKVLFFLKSTLLMVVVACQACHWKKRRNGRLHQGVLSLTVQ